MPMGSCQKTFSLIFGKRNEVWIRLWSFIEAFSGNIVKVLGKTNVVNKDMSVLMNQENKGTRYTVNSKLGPEQRGKTEEVNKTRLWETWHRKTSKKSQRALWKRPALINEAQVKLITENIR